jgi:hypothetical protein
VLIFYSKDSCAAKSNAGSILLYIGLTQKAALPLFEGFAKQNLPQTLTKAL